MKSLTKYLSKRKRNIEQILHMPYDQFDTAAFHKLRVEIKKLNALCTLINKVVKKFHYKKTFKPFKKIFDQAGTIREIQLEQALISKNPISVRLTDYLSDLKNSLLIEKNEFFSTLDEFKQSGLKKKFKHLRLESRSAKESAIVNYIYLYRRKIRKILSSAIEKEQAHQLRKKLKTFDFFRRMVNMEDCIRYFPNQEKLISALGNWHDGQVTIQHLDQCIDTACVPHAEFRPLQKLKEKIYVKNERLLNEINKLKRP